MVLAALEQPDSGIALAQHSQLHFKLLGCVHLQEFCGDPDLEAVGTIPNSVHLGDVPVPPELAQVELSLSSLGCRRLARGSNKFCLKGEKLWFKPVGRLLRG